MASDLGLHCLSMSYKKDTRLIWAFKGKKIMGSLLFPLRVQGSSKGIENTFKGHFRCMIDRERPKIKFRQYISPLKSPNFDAANTKYFTVIMGRDPDKHCHYFQD